MKLLPLGVQDTAWAAPRSWNIKPLAGPADLYHLPIVSNPPRSAMFRQIKDWFATAGLEPARLDICSSVAVIGHLPEGSRLSATRLHENVACSRPACMLVKSATEPSLRASPRAFRLPSGSASPRMV